MKNRAIICICLIVALLFGICIGAGAAGGLEPISAYLTYNTKIKLDGQLQNIYDANGKQVFPINYQGTTYLPIRGISNLLGIDVNWDAATRTVLLGKTGMSMDFIETLEPYSGSTWQHFSISDKETATIAGTVYDHYIMPSIGEVNYDLGGKYETLSFDAYSKNSYVTLYLYGDNDTLLYSIGINGGDLPTHHTIDVSGVQQLTIETNAYSNYMYIFNATIE